MKCRLKNDLLDRNHNISILTVCALTAQHTQTHTGTNKSKCTSFFLNILSQYFRYIFCILPSVLCCLHCKTPSNKYDTFDGKPKASISSENQEKGNETKEYVQKGCCNALCAFI